MLGVLHLLSVSVRVPGVLHPLARARPAAAVRTTVTAMTDEPDPAADEPQAAAWSLPFDPFDWSALWGSDEADEVPKLVGVAPSELALLLAADLGERKYIVTGDLTASLFADDCNFVDPNNAVRGLARYRKVRQSRRQPQPQPQPLPPSHDWWRS